jgi:hypothetical protein
LPGVVRIGAKERDEFKTRAQERERNQAMSVLDSLRKGFSFLLLSFGVSSQAKKPQPASKPVSRAKSSK